MSSASLRGSNDIICLTAAELVPHFEQSDESYMAYPGIREAYRAFDIETSFNPQATDGKNILLLGSVLSVSSVSAN